MNPAHFQSILVATDFSLQSEAALKQAIWMARQSGAQILLTHVLPDIRKALLSASPSAQFDAVAGEGALFQQEIRKDSDARMQHVVAKLNATDLNIRCETLLGDPALSLVQLVHEDHPDLVIVGTNGQSAWGRLFLGSTAKKLIRNCPAPVWVVKGEKENALKAILAATDFSEVSLKAARTAYELAKQTGAELHVLHVIDSNDVPGGAIERLSPGGGLREAINQVAAKHLAEFVTSLGGESGEIHSHLSSGIPSQEVARQADHLKIDLLVLGTIGRSGITGMLLGNTSEKVLDTCGCSILTLKPDAFVSPIGPAFWSLHPNKT